MQFLALILQTRSCFSQIKLITLLSVLYWDHIAIMPVLDVTDLSTVSPSKRARTETKPEDEKYVLRFSKLSDLATTPTRGSAKAAGYDLYRLIFFFFFFFAVGLFCFLCSYF